MRSVNAKLDQARSYNDQAKLRQMKNERMERCKHPLSAMHSTPKSVYIGWLAIYQSLTVFQGRMRIVPYARNKFVVVAEQGSEISCDLLTGLKSFFSTHQPR